MNNIKLQQYASLLVNIGIKVKKGEEVFINAGLDQPDFVTMVVEECYKSGAKKVSVNWSYNPIENLTYKYQKLSTLSKVPPYVISKYKYLAKTKPCILHIISDDPDALKGINPNKIATSSMRTRKKLKPYRDEMDGKYKWCIAAVPGEKWAKKIFPKLNKKEAIEKLWDAILTTSRVDETNTLKNWEEHNAFLIKQRDKLDSLKLRYLVYKSTNGTDFKVELLPDVKWGAGIETLQNGDSFNPNIPTEEVFTTPKMGSCEGKLVATKPLSYNGQLIEDFEINFENGRVSSVSAKKNQKTLEKMIKMDEGASMLGEVALVPFTSPINVLNVLFYETLFDENAVCHVALGAGFQELLANGVNLTTEEAKQRGINDSIIHVDFMIGSSDLSIVGIDNQGKEVQIFKNGNWSI